MTRERFPSPLVRGAVLLAAALLARGTAHADFYPVNTCVAAKQREAATYCRRALAAWATWDSDQNAAARDTLLFGAAAKLGDEWARANHKALGRGTNCADTTLSAVEATDLVDADIAALVQAVNAGLDLGDRQHATCGEAQLRAAAGRCRALLGTEGVHVGRPDRDPHGEVRAAARARAVKKFEGAWGKRVVPSCGPLADLGGVAGRVDGLVDAVVRQTTVSPNVDAARFTTITSGGPVAYQGREFSAVCMNGSPYAYFVKRGTVNKLVMYYQGGGACWENLTCSVPVCDTNVNPAGGDNPNNQHHGFGDLDNPANPFRDWNIVFVSYCSCDIHFGDAAQDYSGLFPPIHVEHRGFHNAKIVEKWAREHFVDPEEVFVTGSSAGAYGAWFHAPLLHQVWPAAHFDVLADAGNGVITQRFLDEEFPHWNFVANLPAEFPEALEVLQNGSGIPGYTEAVAKRFPDTRWAHYSAAFDGGTGGQSGFYNVMRNPDDVTQWLSWWNASCPYNQVMRDQAIATAAAVPSNYRYYIGTGSRHTMYGSDKVYTDTTGGVPTIVDWVNGMLGASPAWTNVECTNCGLTLPDDPVPSPLQLPFKQVGADVVVDCGSVPTAAFGD